MNTYCERSVPPNYGLIWLRIRVWVETDAPYDGVGGFTVPEITEIQYVAAELALVVKLLPTRFSEAHETSNLVKKQAAVRRHEARSYRECSANWLTSA